MNKQAFLQETYDSAFNDELEKISMMGKGTFIKKFKPSGKLSDLKVVEKFQNIMDKHIDVARKNAKKVMSKKTSKMKDWDKANIRTNERFDTKLDGPNKDKVLMSVSENMYRKGMLY